MTIFCLILHATCWFFNRQRLLSFFQPAFQNLTRPRKPIHVAGHKTATLARSKFKRSMLSPQEGTMTRALLSWMHWDAFRSMSWCCRRDVSMYFDDCCVSEAGRYYATFLRHIALCLKHLVRYSLFYTLCRPSQYHDKI